MPLKPTKLKASRTRQLQLQPLKMPLKRPPPLKIPLKGLSPLKVSLRPMRLKTSRTRQPLKIPLKGRSPLKVSLTKLRPIKLKLTKLKWIKLKLTPLRLLKIKQTLMLTTGWYWLGHRLFHLRSTMTVCVRRAPHSIMEINVLSVVETQAILILKRANVPLVIPLSSITLRLISAISWSRILMRTTEWSWLTQRHFPNRAKMRLPVRQLPHSLMVLIAFSAMGVRVTSISSKRCALLVMQTLSNITMKLISAISWSRILMHMTEWSWLAQT